MLLSKLSYANVVATLALFVALGGTTFAATQLHGSQIKRGTVTGKQIRAGSVPGADLRRNSITGKQVREAKLAIVPRAAAATIADRATLADRAGAAATAETAEVAITAGDAGQLGGLAAGSYLDRCGAGTRAYAGVCIELSPRSAATWPLAAKTCGDAGGRLPTLGELEGFRQQAGITLSNAEHTSAYIDVNGIDSGGELTIGLRDNGARAPGFSYGSSNANYRCIQPRTNN
jgi:hypothetical protein